MPFKICLIVSRQKIFILYIEYKQSIHNNVYAVIKRNKKTKSLKRGELELKSKRLKSIDDQSSLLSLEALLRLKIPNKRYQISLSVLFPCLKTLFKTLERIYRKSFQI